MLFFSGCKINLGLRILRKRDDGFHDIETIFYSVPWHDAIEYQPSDKTSIEILGRTLDGAAEDNTVIKAYRLLKQKHDLPPLHFMLLKNVPSGAGLGGGSANAAAVLKKLNEDFAFNLSENDLTTHAATIGSDCAFFIRDKPCVATGRGEKMTSVEVELKGRWLLVIYPNVHVNTAWAYRTFSQAGKYNQSNATLTDVIHQGVETWKQDLRNDFEDVVFAAHPQLQKIKEHLYDVGAIYAAMSGSGSALFGLFDEKPDEESIGAALGITPLNRFLTELT